MQYVHEHTSRLVGIGAMTRMAAKAYRMADAVRAAGVPVVMGGPHITEVPDEALGRDGGPRHADAIALGEADATWPSIVADAERGALKEVYAPVDAFGKEVKPSLADYPEIPWDRMDLDQFNMIGHFPKLARRILARVGMTWESFHLIPIESGRGCPYGCEFCTVTGFFGDSIRFRSNESVVNELLLLKSLEKRQKGKIAVFFIDDNFAINPARTKSLLREIIARNAQVPWIAQISMNLLRDEELVSLIAQSGGKWIFMGLESIDPGNLKSVAKGFNKPSEYRAVLERLARHDLYAITSFIFGMDGDRPGAAERTLDADPFLAAGSSGVRSPDSLSGNAALRQARCCGAVDPPETLVGIQALHDGPLASGAFGGRGGSRGKTRVEGVLFPGRYCSPPCRWLESKSLPDRIIHLCARLAFRGIYFPQMRWRQWAQVLFRSRGPILQVGVQALKLRFTSRPKRGLKAEEQGTGAAGSRLQIDELGNTGILTATARKRG